MYIDAEISNGYKKLEAVKTKIENLKEVLGDPKY